jgi:choloylglycine hydrolase
MRAGILVVLFLIAAFLGLAGSSERHTGIRIKTTDGAVFHARTMEGEVDFKSTVSIIPGGTEYRGTLMPRNEGG